MKADDITVPSEKLGKIANYILKQQENNEERYGGDSGPYIKVHAEELKDHFGYDFLKSALEVTIYFNMKPMMKNDNISEYWGDKIRIDIIGLNDEGERLPKSELRKMLLKNLREYYKMIKTPRHSYGTLK